MSTRMKRRSTERVPITIRFDPLTRLGMNQAAPRAHESINTFVDQSVRERCKRFGVNVEVKPPPLDSVTPHEYEEGNRSKRIDLRVSPVERAIISAAAEHFQRTQTQFIVNTVLRGAGRYGIDEDFVRQMKRVLGDTD